MASPSLPETLEAANLVSYSQSSLHFLACNEVLAEIFSLEMEKILGLDLDKYLGKPLEVSEEVQKIVDQREQARQAIRLKGCFH